MQSEPTPNPSAPPVRALRPLPALPRPRAETAGSLQAPPKVNVQLTVEEPPIAERRRSADGDPEKRTPPPRPPRPQALYRSDTGDGLSASPLRTKQAALLTMTSHQRSMRLKDLTAVPAVPEVAQPPLVAPPASIPEEEAARKTRHNEELVKEILATERAYVGDIAAVIKSYIRPLETTRKELLTPQERLAIFSNLESILPLNEQLLARLEEEAAKPLAEQRVGGCFLQLVEYLKMYQVYCGGQGEALALLAKLRKRRKDWVAFCEAVRQQPEFRKLGLEDLLIKPMQRLCRYPLLLTELAKLTPEGHPDRAAQLAAKERLDQVIQIANEARRQYEATAMLHKLHKRLTLTTDPAFVLMIPTRYLVRRATLKLWSHKVGGKEKITSGSKRELLLFNDIVMACEARDKKLVERALYPVRDVIAWELQDQRNPHSFGVVRTDAPDTMSFACESAEERDEWIKLILSAAAEERGRQSGPRP